MLRCVSDRKEMAVVRKGLPGPEQQGRWISFPSLGSVVTPVTTGILLYPVPAPLGCCEN